MHDRKSHYKRAQVSDQIQVPLALTRMMPLGIAGTCGTPWEQPAPASKTYRVLPIKATSAAPLTRLPVCRICLTGRKIIHCCRDNAVGIDLGDARASDATRVRPYISGLFAAADIRVRPANSTFGDIKVAIGPKLQAARII